MHLLPVLGALEERRRGEPVVVIGVHSAKFAAEGDPQRIREARARYGVRHPVVVDEGHRVWSSYAVRSWPTLVLIRPDGTIAAMAPGEADLDALDAFVGRLLGEAREDGTLARTAFHLDALPEQPPSVLAFPGKVAPLERSRLAVSDSGHHRILITDGEGQVERVVGSGAPGLSDGPFTEARFRGPQGLAVDGEALFVADTGNHALREVDLERRTVRTLAGTGELGRGVPAGAAPARAAALRSPWDVALAGDYVLVAMAGAHQVWAYHRREGTIGVLAGSGRESLQDGPFPLATFAQPSGLALAQSRLYVADSETSAVRYLDLGQGEVRTLVGKGLFDFGDRDGPADQARLQHPLGIAHGPAGLLVADTYNDKIRRLDEATGEVRTWFEAAGEVTVREPGGLCEREDGRVVVADTNHHRLVEVAAGGRSARVLEVRGATALLPPQPSPTAEDAALQPLPAARIRGAPVALRVRLEAPAGFGFAQGSQASLRIVPQAPLSAAGRQQSASVGEQPPLFEFTLEDAPGSGEAGLELHVSVVVCGKGDAAACWPVTVAYRLPLRVSGDAKSETVDVTVPVPAPA